MTQNRSPQPGLTFLGKLISLLLIIGVIAVGGWVYLRMQSPAPTAVATPDQTVTPGENVTPVAPVDANLPAPQELVETMSTVPMLAGALAYVPTDNTVLMELSEYAGYAGLIAANGGLEPTENSVFFRKGGFKLKIVLSEEESWGKLNSGQMGVSATTADVLAVYGRQFSVVVPAQIGFSRGADGIVVTNNIRRINDLKGQTLVTAQFTETEFFIRYLAQEAGLKVTTLEDLSSPRDPEAVNLIFASDAFSAGDLFVREVNACSTRVAGVATLDPRTTEVVEETAGKTRVLTTNRNLLIIADVMIVNKGFAQANPDKVAALVNGLLEGNRMVRDTPDAYLDVIGKAFKWDRAKTQRELTKVHLSNLPESLAFFSGAIDAAGSFSGIYNNAVLAYGPGLISNPVDADRFVDLQHLRALETTGVYKDQKIAIAPIGGGGGTSLLEGNPLLSKDVRFTFVPNSPQLDLDSADNLKALETARDLLKVSPGSVLLIRGHVDDALVAKFRQEGGEQMVRTMGLRALDLSKQRAAEVQRVLIEKYQAPKDRLEVVGRGWEEPVGADPDPDRRSAQNRRVEVQWFTVE